MASWLPRDPCPKLPPNTGFKEPQIHSGCKLTQETRPAPRCWAPRALPSVRGPQTRARQPLALGRPCPSTADSVPLSLPLCLGGGGLLFLRLPRSLRKPLKSCLVLLGKQALQSVPGDTGHQTSRPGSVAASGSRGVERSPRLVRQEEAGKAETREQPLGCRPRPGLALADAGGRSR